MHMCAECSPFVGRQRELRLELGLCEIRLEAIRILFTSTQVADGEEEGRGLERVNGPSSDVIKVMRRARAQE